MSTDDFDSSSWIGNFGFAVLLGSAETSQKIFTLSFLKKKKRSNNNFEAT